MYSPLNEDFMFQEVHDRVARINPHHVTETAGPTRRWWSKAARVAR